MCQKTLKHKLLRDKQRSGRVGTRMAWKLSISQASRLVHNTDLRVLRECLEDSIAKVFIEWVSTDVLNRGARLLDVHASSARTRLTGTVFTTTVQQAHAHTQDLYEIASYWLFLHTTRAEIRSDWAYTRDCAPPNEQMYETNGRGRVTSHNLQADCQVVNRETSMLD